MPFPISQESRDQAYLMFIMLHIPVTLIVDFQAIFFAARVSPSILREIFHAIAYADPLLRTAHLPEMIWFQTFIVLEIFLQVPFFFKAIPALADARKSFYPYMVVYGTEAAVTTLACLTTVVLGDATNKSTLLAGYVPFFLIPAAIAVDYVLRIVALLPKDPVKPVKPAKSRPAITDSRATPTSDQPLRRSARQPKPIKK